MALHTAGAAPGNPERWEEDEKENEPDPCTSRAGKVWWHDLDRVDGGFLSVHRFHRAEDPAYVGVVGLVPFTSADFRAVSTEPSLQIERTMALMLANVAMIWK